MLDWIEVLLAGAAAGVLVRIAAPWLLAEDPPRPRFGVPWIEGLGMALFALVAAAGGWLSGYAFAVLLLAVTATDVRAKLIPDRLTAAGVGIGIACATVTRMPLALPGQAGWAAGWNGALLLSVAGAGTGFLALEILRRAMGRVVRMEVMGMGDSKLLGVAGAFLGPLGVLLALVPGVLCGVVFGVAWTVVARTPHFPFGPALGFGALLTMLFHGALLGGLFAFVDWMRALDSTALWILQLVLLAVAISLLVRIRRRAARYTEAIEDDYASRE